MHKTLDAFLQDTGKIKKSGNKNDDTGCIFFHDR